MRLFLDANVLFSAAYLERSGVRDLWKLQGVELVTSHYAVEEASRNLPIESQKAALQSLLNRIEVVSSPAIEPLYRPAHGLPEKDQPILWAAIDAQCTHLVTGDIKHFGHLMEQTVEGVTVLLPRAFIRLMRTIQQKET